MERGKGGLHLEIEVNREHKVVSVWLCKSDRESVAVHTVLKQIHDKCKKHGYMIFHFKSKFTQYKSPHNTDNNNTICKIRRNGYMKATGIVRRIEECVIISPRSKSIENTGVSLIFTDSRNFVNQADDGGLLRPHTGRR